MYQYITSLSLTTSISAQWQTTDVVDMALSLMYTKYRQTYLTVKESITGNQFYVPMDAYRTALATSSSTVGQWLESMSGVTLETIPELPNKDLASAKYANAILSGYKIELAKAGYGYTEAMPVTELVDLALTRPQYQTNLSLIHTHCLTKVNGYYHRTAYDGTKAFILDGGVTAAMKRCSHTGIVSFLDIGSIEERQLTAEDFMSLTEGAPLREGVIINLPPEAEGKSIIFILGGYMIQPEESVFFPNSPTSWVLNIQGLPYFQRIFESRKEIDLSSLKLESLDTNKDHALVQESLLSDEVISAYLQLSQTYIAIVDTPELYYDRIHVRVSNIPGLITSYQEPDYPLVMGYGKQVEYSKIQETQYWALRVADAWYKQFAFNTAPTRNVKVLTDHWVTWKPYLRTDGYMLNITGKKKTT
jgi:hypothetical protein